MPLVRRKPVAIIGLTLLAMTTAGCSADSVTFHGGDVPEAEQFLAEVESAWTEDLAGLRANQHADAGCYFVASEDSSDVDPTAFCGPVRHYVDPAVQSRDAAGPGLWDTYTFDQKAIEGGFAFREPARAKLGTELPADAILIRPDGSEPPSDADNLAAPSAPSAKPGLITAADGVEIQNAVQPDEGTIAGPTSSTVVEKVGTAETIVTEAGTRAPAEGERFVVAQLDTEPGFWAAEYEDDFDDEGLFEDDDLVEPDPAYAGEVGEKRTRVSESTLYDGTFVVSAPKDESDVELVVTIAGEDQAFSLATGKFATDPPVHQKTGVSRQYAGPEYEQGDVSISQSLLFTDAYLPSFHPTEGWADEGKLWFTLAVDQVDIESSLQYEMRSDPPRSAVATSDSGTHRNVAPADDEYWVSPPTFEVATDDREFDVTYQPTYFFSAISDLSSPQSGTARMEPQEFEVVFE